MPESQQKKKYTELFWIGTPKTILNNGKKYKKETVRIKSETRDVRTTKSRSRAETPGTFGLMKSHGYSRGALVH